MAIKGNDATGEAEETRALAREVGRRGVAQLEASQARILSETGATGRWILGTLVLLNGGGIALVASGAKDMYPPTISPAMIFFIFGIALAVIAMFVNAASALVMTRFIGEASGHWTQVSITGEISETALKSASNVRRQGLIWSAAPIAIGVVSLFLFMSGAMTLADGVAPAALPQTVSPAEAALANSALNAAAPAPNAAASSAVPAPAPSATPIQQVTPAAAPQDRRAPTQRQQRQPAANPPAQTPAPTPAAAPPAGTP